ncbi:chromosomal replication initiator protein DnaA [Sediminispirochaeta smaragdinae]|jgi:chromosomal replication initiator protein|uniref:Chromosomal replication initiator protein DnaA n=1 Tax=Sediminispirochaeta smaragdinae (strain DSM 11293 / JCM 15392 / SEBR 4228) TaxID=573413 RepID=E1R6M9_SEDSS|nr:chromosomal replication initiator protein DnaA [Sediminispirochaeta smaragdinae]ADK79161.1 chromosomal replication initiator protein DnaA [Sediminispirochaeta smaragdinae DSM 11293]
MNTQSRWDFSIFWQEALNQLKNELSDQEFVMWFSNISYHSSEEGKLILSVPSAFYRDQVKQRYTGIIKEKLYELSGFQLDVDFIVTKRATSESPKEKNEVSDTPQPPMAVKPVPVSVSPAKNDPPKKHPDLRPDYTFENFVIGENNTLAANACMAISKNPGTAYNPCLIYGGVGLGKTHLIQSIGNYAWAHNPDIKIAYVTAETFTNEFIEAIHHNKNHQFKNKYRKVDILLIDDIHFLQEKTGTQEELFHTFNALYETNKQLVFTCDRPVSELKQLTDRLRSRFERGLNVDLQAPAFETRFAILKQKVEEKKVPIDDEVIELICRNVTTNVRDLEAALTRLIAYADLLHKKVTLDIARQQLKDVFSNPKMSNITVEMIQRVTAEYFNLSPNDLRGKKRTKAIAFPRQIAMYITREITEFSTTEVGLEFGGRDHTTVMHACQRVESRMQTDPSLEPIIQRIVRQIKEYGTK